MLKISGRSMCGVGIAALLTAAVPPGARADSELWDALRAGGKVVLMRHAPVAAGPDAGDPLVRDPSCRSERNLSNEGRQRAMALGRRFAEHGVSVARVLHSPYCRTTDTARLAFGDAEPADYLFLLEAVDLTQALRQTDELRAVLASFGGTGNLVLVTHEPNINAVSFELVKHLDVLVIEPKAGKDFEELGIIRFAGPD